MVKAKVLGWKVGERYYIQTVTHYWVGTLLALDEHELVLGEAAWVADSGRHSEFVAGKKAREMERESSAEVLIGRGAIISARVCTQAAETL